jgi:glycosyltransferase involved in cell wall biosynthesis
VGEQATRRLLWGMLRGQRPWRELHWLSLMPGTQVTALGEEPPPEAVDFCPVGYRQPVRRFVEAGALAWMARPSAAAAAAGARFDWVASLEPFSLVTGQMAALAARAGARHAVVLWHNDAGTPLYQLPPYRWAWRRARQADFFLCLVASARDHLLEMGVPAQRCAVVHPGVDTRLFHPPAAPVAAPVALFASPVAANKGIDRLLEAWPIVRRAVPEARLEVVGRGPAVPLVAKAAAADPAGVQYLGPADPAGVAERMRRAAVFVTAPRANRVWNEQFGLAYIEAMASGLPVVTTICGSNHEAVQPPNVRVPDAAEALAAALVDLLAAPARRAAIGAANRQHVLTHHEVARQAARMGEAFAAAEARLLE